MTLQELTLEGARERLHNVCTVCGRLYLWCPHLGGHYKRETFERAREAAAKTLLHARFGPPGEDRDELSADSRLVLASVFGVGDGDLST